MAGVAAFDGAAAADVADVAVGGSLGREAEEIPS